LTFDYYFTSPEPPDRVENKGKIMSQSYMSFGMLRIQERFQFCNPYGNASGTINEKISAQRYKVPEGKVYHTNSVSGVKIIL